MQQQGTVSVSEATFAREYNEALVHQVVTAFLAGARQGTKAQKTRAEVAGGGRKPWRQKGTGRARAGTIRSPIWRSGGYHFCGSAAGPQPKGQSQDVPCGNALDSVGTGANWTVYWSLLKVSALSSLRPSCWLKQLKGLGVENVLIVSLARVDENLYLAARNLHKVDVCDVDAVDPVSLIAFDKVLVTVDAVKKV